ncbi:MAG: class I SAM-dependent methyltransferase [Nanoarchaeota archaeon]|nr:class I SAM-dependent methyltransferase [Nanoarchaeota archaeon]
MPNFAEKLDDYFIRNLAYFNYRKYVDEMNLQGDERILEIGCGGGNLSRFLAKELSLGELVCIDSSKYWVDKASNRLRNIEFRVEDVLDFKGKNYYDVIVIHYVLHDIVEKENVVDILRNSLKKEGLVHIREPTRKKHGIDSENIRLLMIKKGFLEKKSREDYSFPIKGKVYEGIFKKVPHKFRSEALDVH